MSMSRRGIASAAALIMALAAMLTAAAISARFCARRAEVSARASRIQGREWCLGAAAIAKGQRITSGAWVISHEADGERIAEGPTGIYRIGSDGREQWHFQRKKP